MAWLIRFLFFSIAAGLAGGQQPSDADLIQQGPRFTAPKLKHTEDPVYSQAGLRANVTGIVLLQMIIDRQGVPQEIAVLSPLGFGLDEEAIAAVSNWRFTPGSKDGKPGRVRATAEVHFLPSTLSHDSKAERRRTRFNGVVGRLALTKDSKPSATDVKTMTELADQNSGPANYVLGLWQMDGEGCPKDPVAGLAHIQRAADLHYAAAILYIGKAQMAGDRMPKDEAKGLSLVQEAAALGSKEAQFKLGAMYESGTGVAASKKLAETYFRLCAATGTRECQYRLGKLLLDSAQRTESQWLEAIAWFELAQDHELAAAVPVVKTEWAKLTPEQAKWVGEMRRQLEHKQ